MAFARPERTSKPRLAMVAVLETKPEAKEESNKAFLEDKAALQYVRGLVQIKSTSVTLKSHEGLERVPKRFIGN